MPALSVKKSLFDKQKLVWKQIYKDSPVNRGWIHGCFVFIILCF